MLVCIGIPVHDGRVCHQTVDSLLAEQMLGADQGVHFLVLWESGGGAIGFARNRLARRFLAIPEASSLIFVDADISWTGGELAKLAKRIEPVIGATYRAKTAAAEEFFIDGRPEQMGDVMKVDGLPGGFVKVSRSAFQSINANHYRDPTGEDTADFFPTGFHDGRMYGEDYGFCRLYREHGGTVFLDPSIVLRHHDGNTVYTGSPLDWLNKAR